METSGTGIGRLDCYEDMFKEITRKLYGEDPDHRTSSVQNEFETSVSYKNDEDTGNGTDGSDDGNWTLDDEPLKGTEGSRIAAYRAATSTWRCYECGDCMSSGPREVAEHFVELHSSRVGGEESSRGRLHSSRKDYLGAGELKLEEVVSYLERVRDRAERSAPPTRRTQETQTIPAALLPVTSTFLLQELPSTPPQHLHQSSAAMPGNLGASTNAAGGGAGGANSASGKRYTCLYCPYGTDRRDLYTRHENIHREEKPFHCYVCYKPFSRADHVKKHFLRMHREHTYELSRIRRPVGSISSAAKVSASLQSTEPNGSNAGNNNNVGPYPTGSLYSNAKQQQQHQQHQQQSDIAATSSYQLQAPTTSAALYQAASLSSAVVAAAAAAANVGGMMQQPEANCGAAAPVTAVHSAVHNAVHNAVAQAARRIQNGACSGKSSHFKSGSAGSSKANQERRYTCCYCSWSGVDNWCLKRHLNTHLKPFACALCEYKAARAERLATHVLKVHNRRQCSRCSFLAEDLAQLQVHQLHVHRVSNANAAAAAAAAAAATAHQQGSAVQQQQQQQHQQQSQTQNNGERQQPQSMHPVGGGRPPPGPPVFPASSAAIAPATTVIPPTTILGDRSEIASMPGNACWEQESSSCESRFLQCSERRSRKQRMPRKITTMLDSSSSRPIVSPQNGPAKTQDDSKTRAPAKRPLLRCFLCPDDAPARALRTRPYHNSRSMLLHKLWRHKKTTLNWKSKKILAAGASITLKATLYTQHALEYQR
ncbi:PREDICTED: zinc finger protein 865 [Ceratosolen solmsi marchali]|uniref:Zinc finger protein 865 n=1 Tax=Ceratosolen solmsi marchali TaxID=326594 RepID=A0AAJ6YR34_9HYME|nr:PREDICTED: zinc finger protein 865 [Ceratosolen solmsi marchali]